VWRSFAAEINPNDFQVAASRLEEEFGHREERREHAARRRMSNSGEHVFFLFRRLEKA
jgi:4-diphosphocytidyl-2C-methyl-D-erythritol kinase